ncbi:hypothetical protein N825_09295 [Skermanella stibiiresistens SB22]|uniref:HTH gntR-type domain-containing protein n=1 Tax=Skermanella stibiiresistens SB22 TaxID=1385369 RepID=W9GV44_9PROT|nr:hypothetical protein N825_09295 [Skermanella stibiiresistens SB22]
MKPGDRINEAELARRFGISRNPIREAISGLLQRGFLVSEPRRGAFMRSFTAKDVDDVFSFRICVETFAIRQAMPMMDPAARAEFTAIVDHMIEAAKAGDVGAVRHLDVLLHRRLCERSRNRQTLRAHEAIDTEMQMLMASVDLFAESLIDGASAHVPIAEAIMGGDPEKVVAALTAHIEQTWRHARAFYEELERAEAAASKTRRKRSADPGVHPIDPSEEEIP